MRLIMEIIWWIDVAGALAIAILLVMAALDRTYNNGWYDAVGANNAHIGRENARRRGMDYGAE